MNLAVSVWVSFWVLWSVPLVSLWALVPVPHSLDDGGLVILPAVWESDASCLLLVCQDCFGRSWSLVVAHRFLDCLFQVCEKCHG